MMYINKAIRDGWGICWETNGCVKEFMTQDEYFSKVDTNEEFSERVVHAQDVGENFMMVWLSPK